MPNVKDVSILAGVSVGSVSRVFNGHPAVSEEISSKVFAAASELGYLYPGGFAARGKRSATGLQRIGLITLGMNKSLTGLPVIASLLQGAHRRAEQYNQMILVCDVPNPVEVPAIIRNKQVDGVVVKAALQGTAEQWRAPAVEALAGLPHVWLTGRPAGCVGDVCGSDDFAVGSIAADYLVSRGHRRLAFVNPKADHVVFRRREASFCWHANELGAETVSILGKVDPSLTFPFNPVDKLEDVDALIGQMLRSPNRPTAIFTPADSIAVLVYRALAQRGIAVGRDLSIISCNHEEMLCAGLYPSLTTIDVHSEQIGAYGVDHLVRRAADSCAEGELTVSLTPVLVEGDSVANIESSKQ
jgi:LacI family transcriptional regulator